MNGNPHTQTIICVFNTFIFEETLCRNICEHIFMLAVITTYFLNT